MVVYEVVSFLFCIPGVQFITLAPAKKDSVTYVVRSGKANISWEIDRRLVHDYYVDVMNPMHERMFQCQGRDPVNVAKGFEGKYQFYGNCSNGIISFSVFNATNGDAGQYTSIIQMLDEVVGSKLLVVFDSFPMPDISGPKSISEFEDLGLTVSCQVNATGIPPEYVIPVYYTWKRNSEIVKSSAKYRIRDSKLTINYLKRSDLTDHFTCMAWNEYGVTSAESTALKMSQFSIYLGSCEMNCIYGQCETDGDEFRCVCLQGWTGINCSTEIDECSSSPCYGGTCYDNYKEYLCICSPGWTGKRCEIDIDDCASYPCMNGGSCNDLQNNHTCQCTPGWTGDICESAVHECSSETCVNGMCLEKTNSSMDYYCACNDGWTGTNCNTAHGTRTSSPVLIASVIGGTCLIIAVMSLIVVRLYRRYKPRVNTEASINREEVVFHGIDQINSGYYWTIDDEQLNEIRGQVKTYLPDEAIDNNLPDCNQLRSAAGTIESVMDETETGTDGYIHPIISIFSNSESEGKDVQTIKENSFSWQDCQDFQVKARDINSSDLNTCFPADEDMEPVIDRIETDTDGYLQPIALH